METLKSSLKKIPFLVDSVYNYRGYKRKEFFKSIFKETGLPDRPKQKVLVYPDQLSWWNGIRAVLEILNFEITYDIDDDYLFAIKWHDCTYKTNEEWLKKISCSGPVLNSNCLDISKNYVDKLSREVFKYSTLVNPSEYHGRCVKKSDTNSRHDGKIIACPIGEDEIQDGYIYQILVNNEEDGKYVEDIRVPFYKDHIPFVYLKYKLLHNKFVSKNEKVYIRKTTDIFSEAEIEKLIALPLKMGLDFAEMDVLRSRDNGLIYVIDVNDTPGALPRNYGSIRREGLTKMTTAFYNSFLKALY